MTERVKLTEAQRRALALLGALHDRHPRLAYGFNPRSFGGGRNAATARALANRGLVHLDRISERHIRYRITDAGRQALKDQTNES